MTLLSKILWSFRLDYQFVFLVPGISWTEKILFLTKKYAIFTRNLFCRGKAINSVTVFGKKYYYDELYGLTSLQRVYCAGFRLREHLPEHPVVIDVGANNGQFSFFCYHYLGAKRVISIEPLKDCFEVLKLNSLVPWDCHNILVSSSTAKQKFYRSRVSSQLSSVVRDVEGNYESFLLIPGVTLDELMAENMLGRIDLLKIDTEGSEYDVLVSGEQTLAKVGAVLVEMSVFRVSMGNLFSIGTFLEGKGFSLYSLSEIMEDQPKDIDGFFRRP